MPPTYTVPLSLIKPDGDDEISIADLNSNSDTIAAASIPIFVSTAARNNAYAVTNFKVCVVGASIDAGVMYVRRGGQWQLLLDVGQFAGMNGSTWLGAGRATNGDTLATCSIGPFPMNVSVNAVYMGLCGYDSNNVNLQVAWSATGGGNLSNPSQTAQNTSASSYALISHMCLLRNIPAGVTATLILKAVVSGASASGPYWRGGVEWNASPT